MPKDPSREAHFLAIEKKYGFSQAHTNAIKKTIQLPIDWEVDDELIQAVIKASLANLK